MSSSKSQSYVPEVIAASPFVNHDVNLPVVPQLQGVPRVLPSRVAAMFKILVNFATAFLVTLINLLN